MYYLYTIWNKCNNKLYIGITQNPLQRWKRHQSTSKGNVKNRNAIHWALAKYGINNFIFKIMMTVPNFDIAKAKEIKWIAFFKMQGYQLYNETDGGDGISGFHWTEEQKQISSIRNSGSGNPMYGVQLFGSANGNFGKEMKPHVRTNLLECRRKLTDEQVAEIKTLYATGNYTQTQLSKDFNISLTQTHCIVKGKSWSNESIGSIKEILTKEQFDELLFLYKSGDYTRKHLAKKYNIPESKVHKIIKYKKWK